MVQGMNHGVGIWEKDIEKVLRTVNQLAKFTYFSLPAKLAAMMHKS